MLHRDGGHDTESPAATAAQSPEEVGILTLVGYDEAAVWRDRALDWLPGVTTPLDIAGVQAYEVYAACHRYNVTCVGGEGK